MSEVSRLTIQTLLPNGRAIASDGSIWQYKKWDGPNYSYRTPVDHDARTRHGYKHSYYPVNASEYPTTKTD